MIIRLAIRELIHRPRWALYFILNLSIGLTSFIALDITKRAMESNLESSAKQMAGGDITISVRGVLEQKEQDKILQVIPTNFSVQEAKTIYSMLSSENQSLLTEIQAVENEFPFYGHLKGEVQGKLDHSNPKRVPLNQIWLDPNLAKQLKVTYGDSIKLGHLNLKVTELITEDTTSSWLNAAYAPKAYINLQTLHKTGLIQPGSTLWNRFYLKINPGPSGKNIQATTEEMRAQIHDHTVTIQSYQSKSQQSNQALGYVSDYLSLTSLVAMFLAGLGAAYMFQTYLAGQFKDTAIFISLGLTPIQTTCIFIFQLGALGTLASLLSLAGATALTPTIANYLEIFQQPNLSMLPSSATIATALIFGVFGALLSNLPLLSKMTQLRPADLFSEHSSSTISNNLYTYLAMIPGIGLFWAVAIWQAHSFVVGSIFMAIFILSGFLLITFSRIAIAICSHTPRSTSLPIRLGALSLARNPLRSTTAVVAIGLGALLMNLIPQIQHSLHQELNPDQGNLPSLFMFDIQEEQKPLVENMIRQQKLELGLISPLIRARILDINGVAFEQEQFKSDFTRESEQQARFRNRGVNLSFREKLDASETILEGRAFSGEFNFEKDLPMEISVETRYSERIGLFLDDLVTFEVQGIPIPAKVVSIRKVKWNSFQPNFFITTQPGALEDAPKTFIASIKNTQDSKRLEIQDSLVKSFPNISIVDVKSIISKLVELSEQMRQILTVMASFALLSGLLVLFSIAHEQAQMRQWDINLLKLLGCEHIKIQLSILFEFSLIAILAAIFGAFGGLSLSYAMAKLLFDSIWNPNLSIGIILLLIISILSIAIVYLATRNALQKKPDLKPPLW